MSPQRAQNIALLGVLFRPARRFRNRAPDVKNEERGHDTDHEQAAPSVERKENAVSERSNEITARIAGLQNARYEAARLRRDRFHRQRTTHAPFSAHGNAE